MTNTGKYFLFHFKKTLIRLAVIVLAGLILTDGTVLSWYNSQTPAGVSTIYYNVNFYMMCFYYALVALVVPILELASFHNKCALDTFFSVPIRRTSLVLTHMTNGALQISISLFLSCFWATVKIAKIPDVILFNMLPFFLGMLLLMLAYYSVNCFAFLSANRVVDGALLAVLYTGVPIALYIFAERVMDSLDLYSRNGVFNISPVISMSALTDYFEHLFSSGGYRYSPPIFTFAENLSVLLSILIGFAAVLLSIWLFCRKRAEKAGGISDAWWGYPILVPFFGFNLVMHGGSFLWGVFVGIMVFIGYVIYRRSPRLRIHEWILLGIITLIGILDVDFIEMFLG